MRWQLAMPKRRHGWHAVMILIQYSISYHNQSCQALATGLYCHVDLPYFMVRHFTNKVTYILQTKFITALTYLKRDHICNCHTCYDKWRLSCIAKRHFVHRCTVIFDFVTFSCSHYAHSRTIASNNCVIVKQIHTIYDISTFPSRRVHSFA